jgi:hypothetical protein
MKPLCVEDSGDLVIDVIVEESVDEFDDWGRSFHQLRKIPGAQDYTQDAQGPVVLEILDGEGKVLRRYSSQDKTVPTPDQLRTNLIPPMWAEIHGPLPAAAGMHRWVWDLRRTAPMATHYDDPIAAVPHRTPLEPQGPLVVPGTYTVRLTFDGQSESAPLVVKMDPRVHTSLTDLEALDKAQTTMASSLDELARADLAAHSVSEQLAAPENASLGAQIASFSDQLKRLLRGTEPESPKPLPGLDQVTQQATELYSQLQRADAAPTPALLAAAAHVEEEGRQVLPGWGDFKTNQLPALDQKLRDAHRPAIDLDQSPAEMPQSGDQD